MIAALQFFFLGGAGGVKLKKNVHHKKDRNNNPHPTFPEIHLCFVKAIFG